MAFKYENGAFSARYGAVLNTSLTYPYQWVNYPTHGLFLAICDGMSYDTDSATKVVGALYCKDSVPPAARLGECASEILSTNGKVLISQASASEWVVYFTEVMDAMIDGKNRKIPPY